MNAIRGIFPLSAQVAITAGEPNWSMTLAPLALLAAAALATAVGIAVYRRRGAPGWLPFVLLMAALAWWSSFNAMEKGIPDYGVRVMCAKLEYLGIAAVPLLFLMFALEYAQERRWLSRRDLALLFVLPALTVVIVFTNEWHHLLWTEIRPAYRDQPGSFLVYNHGLWFWIFTAYNYVLVGLGTLAIARAVIRFRRLYRRQAAVLLVALAVPWASNAIHLAGFNPWIGLDPTPIAFILTGVVCAWGMIRLRLFDLVPVARDAVIESMRDGVFVIDSEGRLVDINPSAQRLLGIARDVVLGQPMATVWTAWPSIEARLSTVAQTEVWQNDAALEVEVTRLTGSWRGASGVLVLVRDISERKRIEQMRDELTQGLVHDLRNPLTGIRGALDLVAETGLGEETSDWRRMLENARGNTLRMLALIDDILDVARLESGRMPLDIRPTPLGPLVANVLESQAGLVGSRGQRLVANIPTDLPEVAADSRLITRVLHNLIDNASKFAPADTAIRIDATRVLGAEVRVAVSDEGRGISPEIRERLFEKFVSDAGAGHGAGIGLAFCRLVLEAHGGHIWAESGEGGGTVVRFTLGMVVKPSGSPPAPTEE